MARFRDIKTLQKFAAAHASIHNHFNQARALQTQSLRRLGRVASTCNLRFTDYGGSKTCPRLSNSALKRRRDFNEQWLHDRIADDPSILGFGDVRILDRERSLQRGGRLDIRYLPSLK